MGPTSRTGLSAFTCYVLSYTLLLTVYERGCVQLISYVFNRSKWGFIFSVSPPLYSSHNIKKEKYFILYKYGKWVTLNLSLQQITKSDLSFGSKVQQITERRVRVLYYILQDVERPITLLPSPCPWLFRSIFSKVGSLPNTSHGRKFLRKLHKLFSET